MKQILFIISLLFVSLNADEIQRIESIVKSIQALQSENIRLKNEIKECKNRVSNKDENYNKVLEKKETRIDYLENQRKLTNKVNSKKSTKKCTPVVIKEESLVYQIIEDDNPFPKLKMKKEHQPKAKPKPVKLKKFKASSFRVNGSADVYNGYKKEIIETWEDKRSFTSNQGKGNWIKITGYFVDKKWRAAKSPMWVKSCDVVDRSKVTH